MAKVTWEMIYEDFKKKYPQFSQHSYHFEPYDFAKIKVYLEDGIKFVYDYDAGTGWMVKY